MHDLRRALPGVLALGILATGCVNFADPVTVTVRPGAPTVGQAVAMADITGNGLADPLVLADGNLTRMVSCGSECLQAAETISIPTALSLAAGDVDADGFADAVVGLDGDDVIVYFGGPAGLDANDTTTTTIGLDDVTEVDLGDFDGDGILDLFTATEEYGYSLGTGTGEFGPSVGLATIFSSAAAVDYAIGDLDGDGDDDVAFAISAIPDTLLTTALVDPRYPNVFTEFSYGPLAMGDLDGDGLDDVMAYHVDDTIIEFRSTGTAFVEGQEVPVGDRVDDLVLDDLDGDGDIDMIATNGSVVSWWNGAGDGSFVSVNGITRIDRVLPAAPRDMAFGDVDGDGRKDLLVNFAGDADGDVALLSNASINP